MMVVRGLKLSTKLRCVERERIVVQKSLFSNVDVEIKKFVYEVTEWKLVVQHDYELTYLDSGTKVKVIGVDSRTVCAGEILCSVIKRGDEIRVVVHRELCKRSATKHRFCSVHSRGEYSSYIGYVFGLRNEVPSTGLAMIPHLVYAMHAGLNNVKVGIANMLKNVTRLFEQIFLYATILTITEDVHKARSLELRLSSISGVVDRMRVSDRIRALMRALERRDYELKRFVSILLRMIDAINGGYEGGGKDYIPILTLVDEHLDFRRVNKVVENWRQVREGVYVIAKYVVGGIVLENVVNNEALYIPYASIRDRVLPLTPIQ